MFRGITTKEPRQDHLVLLIKAISEMYLQVRYSYSAKQFSTKILAQKSVKSRQIYKKIYTFLRSVCFLSGASAVMGVLRTCFDV